MTESSAGGFTGGLDWNELALDHFAVNCHRLEVTQFVSQFSITLLATKVVDAVLNSIRLSCLESILRVKVPRRDHSTDATLDDWLHRRGRL